MKKLFFAGLLAIFTLSASAQKKLTEGTIVYEVKWQLPPQAQQMAAMLPNEISVHFKGDSTVMINKGPMSTTASIMNRKADFQRLLLDIPIQNKKYSVTFTPADLDMMEANMPELKLSAGSESKTIAGLAATKYAVTESKSKDSFDAWFTKDVQVPQSTVDFFYDAKFGFPVQFVSYQNGLKFEATVKEIREEKVPAGVFSGTKDYETISFQQLMQMSGGRRN